MRRRYFPLVGTVSALALILCAGGYYLYTRPAATPKASFQTPEEADMYVRFVMEGYDSIVKNYWMKAKEDDFTHLFALSLQKATQASTTPVAPSADRAGVAQMLSSSFAVATSTDTKKKLAQDTLTVLLYNLQPIGRNSLFSEKQTQALRETVSNINPETDLYKNLGLAKGADAGEITKAYTEKETELKHATSTEAKKELEKITYAKNVLTNPDSKVLYDEAKIEPTVWSRRMGETLYLSIGKISPTTLQEFGRAIELASTTPKLSNLLIDVRGNVGGALDFLQYFLGLFIGEHQFAFDFFHQGDYEAQRTVTSKWNELARYKEIVFLTDKMTQSTAELTAATFKRLHLGIVVGEPTRGWGSVENTFPMETVIDPSEKFSLFLVHRLTLRDDNQPIEQNGVEPDIDTRKTNWKQELPKFFRSASLIQAISKTASELPVRK